MIDFTQGEGIERVVIGTILQNGCTEWLAKIKAYWFGKKAHKDIFKAMKLQAAKGMTPTMTTLFADFPDLDAIALTDCCQNALVVSEQIKGYVEMLGDFAARRDLIQIGEKLISLAQNQAVQPSAIASEVRTYLNNTTVSPVEATTMADELVDLYESLFDPEAVQKGIETGIGSLDKMITGFIDERLYVIGARPSVGKTVFGMIAAVRAGRDHKRTLIINREMAVRDYLKRMMAHVGGIPVPNLNTSDHDLKEMERISDAITAMGSYKMVIDSRSKTPNEIYAKAQQMAEEPEGLGMVVIDYLQRLQPNRRGNSRNEEIGAICWMCKEIATTFKVPVILLSQLNRDASNKRPTMANLRESGDIEQDADVVILLHRPDYDDVKSDQKEKYMSCPKMGGEYLEMIVDKNRHGQCGIVPVCFMGNLMRYKEL